jgi:hypothetical protein
MAGLIVTDLGSFNVETPTTTGQKNKSRKLLFQRQWPNFNYWFHNHYVYLLNIGISLPFRHRIA